MDNGNQIPKKGRRKVITFDVRLLASKNVLATTRSRANAIIDRYPAEIAKGDDADKLYGYGILNIGNSLLLHKKICQLAPRLLPFLCLRSYDAVSGIDHYNRKNNNKNKGKNKE